jgi:hypothetical protein
MVLLRGSPARPSRRPVVWLTLALLASAGAAAAQPSVAIPPPRSWEMLGLARSLPALAGRRGPGTPCDTGATIAPDRIRVTGDGVACLPNPAHETWMWCGLIDPVASPPPTSSIRFQQTAPSWENSIRGRSGYSEFFILLPPPDSRPANWDSVHTGPGPTPLESSRSILRALETEETRAGVADSSAWPRLAIVDTLLQREVRAHGPGQDARLLTARLRRLQWTSAWMAAAPTGPGDARFAAALAAVEDAVSAAPGRAEAHAWRAALLDTRVPRRVGDTWEAAPLDRAGALASLRAACDLAPDYAGLPLALARWLAGADDVAGARDALRSCGRSDRTLVGILEDLCRLPRFRDLGFHPLDDYTLTGWRGRLAEAMRSLGRDADFLEFRLRGWSWPGSAATAETTLQQAWPGFAWFRVEDPPGGFRGALYAQRVVSPTGDAAPAKRPSSVRHDLEGGISLILLERATGAGEPPCCTLVLVDWRVTD